MKNVKSVKNPTEFQLVSPVHEHNLAIYISCKLIRQETGHLVTLAVLFVALMLQM